MTEDGRRQADGRQEVDNGRQLTEDGEQTENGRRRQKCSGVAIAGSAGTMNPGTRPLGAPDDVVGGPYRNNVRQAVSSEHKS